MNCNVEITAVGTADGLEVSIHGGSVGMMTAAELIVAHENYKETYHLHDLLTEYHKKLWWYITQCDYNLYFHNGKVYTKYTDIFTEGKE